ncbi:MAG: exo-alpha-sialidase [Planctomycetota bacterium]
MPAPASAQEVEILKITVGRPTTLSPVTCQNCSSLASSRTGALAAFYPPRPSARPEVYRVSTDAGSTWAEELPSPAILFGGACSTPLREGGVLQIMGTANPTPGDPSAPKRLLFSDDFLHYETSPATVDLPGAVLQTRWASFYPAFDKGKILELPDGGLLAPMYGYLEGDTQYRVLLMRSADKGHSWRYYSTVAYDPDDPDPDLVGQYCGFCEPSFARLPNGQLLCVMRTQGTHLPAEYRPLYVAWSDDLGKTWTKPVPTQPHLMNIWPTLAVLDNGVVACAYGRPGFHVAFSIDNGRTWRDRVSFSHLSVNEVTGQVDIVKAGPNKLVAIGGTENGTKVFPITVERLTVPSPVMPLSGRVLNESGAPIADALLELAPNRYVADSHVEPAENAKLDQWRAAPEIPGAPELRYQSIRPSNGYPTVRTDARGAFRFETAALGEHILTVEAKGYAPQYRRVAVAPGLELEEFRLKPGRSIRGRVVDADGRPLPGMCVVLETSHVHTDPDGFFHWAVVGSPPDPVRVKVYRKYGASSKSFSGTLPLSQIMSGPITVK